jgi:hypothetical protein
MRGHARQRAARSNPSAETKPALVLKVLRGKAMDKLTMLNSSPDTVETAQKVRFQT